MTSRLHIVPRLLAITLSCGLVLEACAIEVSPYRAALDGLPLPSAWHAAKTIARGDGGETGCIQLADALCPSVTRYYTVPGELPDLNQQARAAVMQSGFTDVEDTSPNCDLITNAARCSIAATKGGVRIEIYIFDSGQDPDEVGVGVSDEPTVRAIARHP